MLNREALVTVSLDAGSMAMATLFRCLQQFSLL